MLLERRRVVGILTREKAFQRTTKKRGLELDRVIRVLDRVIKHVREGR